MYTQTLTQCQFPARLVHLEIQRTGDWRCKFTRLPIGMENRQTLFALYGEKRVMNKLITVIENQITKESKWTIHRDSFPQSFDHLYSWITSANLLGKQDYLLLLEAEKKARAQQTDKLLSFLGEIWKNDWNIDRKKCSFANTSEKFTSTVLRRNRKNVSPCSTNLSDKPTTREPKSTFCLCKTTFEKIR